MKNVLVVSNFRAGRKQAIKYKKRIQKFLLKKQVRFRFLDVEGLQNVDEIDFDTILTVGGDGTVNKVLPYIIHTDKVLGIIPCGTANLLAESLGINSFSKAIRVLAEENYTKVDIITINNKLSILRFGAGYDSDIICKTPQTLKNKFGYFAYFLAGILFALRLKKKEYFLKIDNNFEQKVIASNIIVANVGNMYKRMFSVAKDFSLSDGLFDVFILKTANSILFFVEFLKILFGIKKNGRNVEYLKAKKMQIRNSYCVAHVDGEKNKFTENLEFNIIREGIKIYSKEYVCSERKEIITEDMQRIMV